MADLYFVRHGETQLNRENKLRGWRDVPLDAQGKEEAKHLAEYFKDHDVVKIVTSDLKRASDTAKEIAAVCQCPVMENKNWRPWDLGQWSGQDSKTVLPDMLKCIDADDKCPPDGEPFSRFRRRVTQALNDIQREAMRSAGECFVVVTHVRDIRMILGILESGPGGEATLKFIKQAKDPVDPGGIVEAEYDKGGWSWKVAEEGMTAPVQSRTVS